MCFQFDVYRNPSERTNELQPYLLVIQHDYYDDLSTRIIIPLSYRQQFNGFHHPVTPLVNIDFETYFINTPGITSIEKAKLKNNYYVCNLSGARASVIAAIDAILTNT